MTDKLMGQHEAMEALQRVQELATKNSAEAKAETDKLAKAFDALESKSQELTLNLAKEEKARLEIEAKFADLEKAMVRPNLATDEKARTVEEFKAVSEFLRNGEKNLTPEQNASFRSDVDVDGGYLVEGEVDRTITRNLVEMSPIRSVAMVQTIRSNRLSIPREDTSVTAGWVGEGGTSTAQAAKFKRDTIDMNKMEVTLAYTHEMLEDSFTDLEGYGSTLIAEKMAQLEGTAFVSGNGVLKPEGFVDADMVSVINSGAAADLGFDSIIDLAAALKTGYNGKFFFNSATMFALMQKKSGTNYLWSAGNVAAGVPNSILGQQYVVTPDMDSIAANAYPIAFADLARGYKIIQKTGTTIIRDIYSLKKEGKVETTIYRRVGGGIIQPEAIKILKCTV